MFLEYFAWEYSRALYYITYEEENISWQCTSILLVLHSTWFETSGPIVLDLNHL
jgi:hypothetical protein